MASLYGAGAQSDHLAGSLLLFALRMVTDEGYQLEAAKNYMIEFLENTYARRYEKMSQTAEVEEEIQLVEKKAVLEEGPTENEKETIAAFQAEAESQEMEEAAPAGRCSEASPTDSVLSPHIFASAITSEAFARITVGGATLKA